MYQLNIHINYKAQKSFINSLAASKAVVLFIIAMIIPTVYVTLGQLKLLSLMPIVTYVFMTFVRLFMISQLVVACLAIKNRFQLLNDAFSRNDFFNNWDPLNARKSALKCYGSIFHQLCDSIETINQSLTFQFIPLVPHILVINCIQMKHSIHFLNTF